MRFYGKILFSPYFSKFAQPNCKIFIKNNKTSGDILKRCSLVMRVTVCFIKSDKTYTIYYLKSITAKTYFLYICCIIK